MLNIEACCHSAIEPQKIRAKNWKQSKSLLIGKQRKKLYGISILLRKKEKGTLDTCNMDESQMHHAKWKKPDKRESILYGSIYNSRKLT